MSEQIQQIRTRCSTTLPQCLEPVFKNLTKKATAQFAMIEENEAAFSSKESAKPILFTNNVHQCITCVVSDPKTKRAGLIHLNYNAINDAEDSLLEMAKIVRGKNVRHPLEIHVVGSDNPSVTIDSETKHQFIIQFMQAVGTVSNATLKTFAVLEDKKDTCFGFDTRSGDMFYGKELQPALEQKLRRWARFSSPEILTDSLADSIMDVEENFYKNCAKISKRFPVVYNGLIEKIHSIESER